jgi:hypothetical protein
MKNKDQILIQNIMNGSVADPGSGAFLTPGSGMGKKSGSGSRNLFDPRSRMEKFGSGINIPDPQHWDRNKKCYYAGLLPAHPEVFLLISVLLDGQIVSQKSGTEKQICVASANKF